MKNKDYKKFASVDKNLAHFYQMGIEKDGILIIDNRLAIPTKLRSACLNWLHRDHPGQLAMIDAASYLWWPKMHTQIIEKAECCSHCRATGKNMKSLRPKRQYDDQPEPAAPNDEVQLDFAGPLFHGNKTKTYLLVAIDSISRFPSASIVKSTSSSKILKFLKQYIALYGVLKSIKTDQFSGFKSRKVHNFCKGLGIEQSFLSR